MYTYLWEESSKSVVFIIFFFVLITIIGNHFYPLILFDKKKTHENRLKSVFNSAHSVSIVCHWCLVYLLRMIVCHLSYLFQSTNVLSNKSRVINSQKFQFNNLNKIELHKIIFECHICSKWLNVMIFDYSFQSVEA